MTSSAKPTFQGPYRDVLSTLAELLDRLQEEHGTSWVRAGDDRVYAFGGDGYIIVFDEKKWDGLVEVFTPKISVAIRPQDGGAMSVSAADLDEKGIKSALREAANAISKYYEKRYWRTP